MYILRARPERTPFHLCHAPSARHVRVPVWKQILQGFGYDTLLVLVINGDKFRDVGHHGIPDIIWCETFDTQGQRMLVRVHHMHILHGCSEAALFFRREPLKLEQRCIIVKHPNISFESSFVQDNTLHNMLELIPTRIWMLASLPSMGDRADDRIPIPFSPGLYFLVAHQGCFSLFGVRRNEGHGLKFLATWQRASGTDQVSEVPEAMHLTLGKSDAKEVPNPQQELRNRRHRNNSRTCTWHEPNVCLHRGGIARTPLRPSSRIEPRSKLVPRCARGRWLYKTILDQEKRRTRTRSRRFNDEHRILDMHAGMIRHRVDGHQASASAIRTMALGASNSSWVTPI